MPRWISFSFIALLLLLSGALVIAQGANAQVIDMANTLNVRSGPSGSEAIVAELPGNTPVNVIARTSTNRWYQITTLDGSVTGWAASDFIQLNVARATIPVAGASASSASSSSSTGSTNTASTTSSTTTTSVEAPVGDAVGTATVNVVAANVRASASLRAAVVAEIPSGTTVNVIGRNSSTTWIRVQLADGAVGWVFANLLDLNVSRSAIPVVGSSTVTTTVTNSDGSTSTVTSSDVNVAVPAGDAPYFTLGASAVNIFAAGQAMGNRANVFSKIGDSITVAEEMFGPFGFGVYNLGAYDYLSPTVSFFSAQARNNNSFNNTSLAAARGFTTVSVLSSEYANPALCNAGESPLACEYRLTRPAVALIMLGTNDASNVPIARFAENMRVIADYSIAQGVIPVMTTIPPRLDIGGRAEAYNQVIIDVARERGLPLWDFYAATVTLPDSGMNADGMHPSSPPLGFEQAGDFRGNNLQYGYVMRNLTMLQALHVLRVQVLQ